ncbi:MAG: RHS repeat-associated core domain-containing protein, partial [Chloroflexota bacterium]
MDEGNGVTVVRGYSQVTGLALNLAATKGSATLAQYTYSYDHYGNLSERDDVFAGSHESEHYDALNRLIKSVLTASGGGGTTTYAYDDAGNLTYRSDRGTYTYGENGAGPHAVTSIDDGSSYGYNANGEMTSGAGRTLAWATFGKATTITQGGTTVTLAYGPDNERYRKTVSTGSETVTYLGAAELIDLAGSTGIRRTLALADLTVIDTGGNNAGVLYPVTDQLGSTIDLGDGNGASADVMSYGPFGKRMTAGWAGQMSISQALTINTTESDKGYTGQEGLDAVQLDDYNARLYDPALGRFLSVDPLIGHPESTQGFNPYSSVENNPLNRTDPTGEVMDQCMANGICGSVTIDGIGTISAGGRQ